MALKERVLWTVLLGAATGASAYLATRVAEQVWRRMTGHNPPKPLGPLGTIGKKTGEGMVARLVH